MKTAILLTTGCVAVALIALLFLPKRFASDAEKPAHVWLAPAGEPYWRDDGEGPYAPSWPTMAVVCKYATNAPGADTRGSLWDSTLFLMALPDLRESHALQLIPSGARFAVPCRSECRGAWVRFAPPPAEPFFVLAHASGGSIGDIVRVFGHSISYNTPHTGDSAFQDHSFDVSFRAYSRITPLIGEVDQDGFVALLVGSEATNSSGAPGTPQRYRVIKLNSEQGGFDKTREIEAADAKMLKQLSMF